VRAPGASGWGPIIGIVAVLMSGAGMPCAAQRLRLGLCDYSATTAADMMDEHLDFIAERFVMFVRGAPYDIDLERMRMLNPGIQAYVYWDALLTPWEPCDPIEAPLTSEMFMTDPVTGNRLMNEDDLFGPSLFMEPGSAAWREHSLREIRKMLALGFDGVHLDDVWADMAQGRGVPIQVDESCRVMAPYPGIPEWYDKQVFQDNLAEYLELINQGIEPKMVVFNGLDQLPLIEQRAYLWASDGVVMEAPVYAELYWPDSPFRTGKDWRLIMQAFLDVPGGMPVSWVSFGAFASVEGRMYSLASYLLGASPVSTFYFTPDCSLLAYFPEWSLDYGALDDPPGDLADLFDPQAGVYRRDLPGCVAVVNPDASGEARTVDLGGVFLRVVPSGGLVPELGGDGRVDLVPVTAVELGPHQGAILLKPPSVRPPCRPSRRLRPATTSPTFPGGAR